MSAAQMERTALSGTTIKNQVDLNSYIEETLNTPERRAALGTELEIAENEWDTLSIDRFNEAITAYRESGRADAYKSKIKAISEAKKIGAEKAKKYRAKSRSVTVR